MSNMSKPDANAGSPATPNMTEEKLRDYLKRVVNDLRQTRRRLSEAEAKDHEPIAIVAMSCRFPGDVRSPEELWRLVRDGGDAITAFPDNRGWDVETLYDPDPENSGTTYVREGGFLHDAAEFDPAFFGISPREALAMDPQQRLLLETSWEAFERAGIDPQSLRGSRTGVFVGSNYQDYATRLPEVPEEAEGHIGIGNTPSVVSGRVSYTFGLEGPAVTVDTACSSSLVALHLACHALRQGDCTMALAGGISVMSSPASYIEFSRQRGLAPDARVKAFGAGADGTALSEGVGLFVVERLSDAQRNGHPVLAVIRGSAINQDGASNGLTAPNGPSQERVIRQALAHARLTPDQVDVVEAHGTGTTLGDPIEAQALLATYGQGRAEDRPLWLGSVKSNIGHTQAAAGAASLIKMIMAFDAATLPRTLHADEPSHRIDWSAGAVELLTEEREWPSEAGRVRRAGVSSFGISGTNAHLVLEEPPAPEVAELPMVDAPGASTSVVVPWVVSGRGEGALRAQAGRLRSFVEARPELAPADIAYSLVTSRAAVENRAVVLGTDRSGLLEGLGAVSRGEMLAAGVVQGAGAVRVVGRTVLVFPGQGSQWVGMGAELIASSPAFAESMRRCAEALAPFVDWDLLEVVSEGRGLDRVDVVQPVTWAVMVSLAELWRSAGVVPDAVVGHSQGEIAAAVVAGALSLEDGARVVALRSQVIGRELAGRGGMASIALPEAEVRQRIDETAELGIAAVNGLSSTVVSGDADAVEAFVVACEADGVRARRIAVDYASHSAHVEAIEQELLTVLEGVRPRAGSVPFYSTVENAFLDTEVLDAAYWYRNLRHQVQFEAGIRALAAEGFTTFVESSAHPVLTVGIQETLDETDTEAVVTGSLRRDEGGLERFLTSAAELYVTGVPVDWTPFLAGEGVRRVDLPTYAFQRERFWLEVPASTAPVATAPLAGGDVVDGRFWAAVEAEDWESLSGTLALAGDAPLSAVVPALASWRRERQRASTVQNWRYRVTWKPAPDARRTAAVDGTWLVVVPTGHAEDAAVTGAVEALTEGGAYVEQLELSAADADRVAWRARIEEWHAATQLGDRPLAGVLSLLALDERPHAGHGAMAAGVAGTLALVQALEEAGIEARLWLGTRGAVSVGGTDQVLSAVQAQVWGLGRVVALELPERWGGLVDLPEAWDGRSGARLCAVLAGALDDEDQLAVRGSGVFARRLVRAPLAAAGRADDAGAQPGAGASSGTGTDARTGTGTGTGTATDADAAWRTRGTALVTGGTGALGPHIARWLADNGAEHVVLVSRRGAAAPGMAELRDELAAEGVRLTASACDVADRDAVAALLAGLAADGDTVRTVIHAAAFIELAALTEADPAEFADVLAAKVAGAAHLDALLDPDDLDAFVLFSSIAGVWGSGDHGAYAAANAFLDALAEQRHARGLPASSIAWGVWDVWDPERLPEGVKPEQLQARGLPFLDPDTAFSALRQVLARNEACVTVADVDWDRFVPVFTSAGPRPLLDGVPEAHQALDAGGGSVGAGGGATGAPADASPSPLRDRLSGLAPAERHAVLLDLVRAQAASVLGHASPEAVAPTRAFRDLGFDSLTAVELRNRLKNATGLRLPATLIFDYPSPAVLAGFLRGEIVGTEEPAATAAPAAAVLPASDDDPIVIVGMACRFPGEVRSPEELWELLARGGEAISELPTDRGWDVESLYDPDPERPGKTYTRHGGFLHDAADFDAGFFGISPREALAMDPQQRLLLETSWEAFERAGIDPQTLRGSSTAVFAGVSYHDYGSRLQEAPEGVEGYLGTGNTASIASGRVSYLLGLEGPAVTLDTGCSSSLVAMHLAAQSLRQGESTLALAGGASVMAVPTSFTEFSRQRGLSVDGRCRAFSADADGMGMAEGAAMLLLERLSDARRNGHPVLAVVRGTAMNQDGASNGLTAPNGPSQQRVIRQALANARLSPCEVDVVEAHGTGTRLGDPIEAQALLATYGQGRAEDRPLWLGSVKSNIGHTQAAAGAAGVIKMVKALEQGQLPRTLHAAEPTPQVDWSAGAVELLTEERAWPSSPERVRRAGVSSFGISGTNAHLVLEEPPAPEVEELPGVADPGASASVVVPWVVSGRGVEALRAQAGRLRSFVGARPELEPVEVGRSLAVSRSAFERRAVVLGTDRGALLGALGAVSRREVPAAGVVEGSVREVGRTVLVFPGQGSQWVGMGAELIASSPVFAEWMRRCAEALAPFVDWDLLEVVSEGRGLDRVDVVQPVTWAVMVSLAELWRSVGVVPDAVLGHSQGEIAAAVVAGGLSLEDGARVVALRSQVIGRELAGRGGMASIALPEPEVRDRLKSQTGLGLAAVNGPLSTVISGDAAAVEAFVVACEADGVRARRIAVDYASHSAHVEAIEQELLTVLEGVRPQAASVPFYSTVENAFLDTEVLDAAYWYRNLRHQVQFEAGIRALAAEGFTTFVESSAHPVLTVGIQETLDDADTEAVVTGSLRRDEGGLQRFLTSAAELYVTGVPVNWTPFLAGEGTQPVDLPTYAFQRERFWLEASASAVGDMAAAGLTTARHPLLGAAVEVAGSDEVLFTGRLSLESHAWLADHAVAGTVLLPGTAFVELAVRAGDEVGCGQVEELALEAPLIVPERGGVALQLGLGAADDSGRRALSIYSRAPGDERGPWTRHATGTLASAAAETADVPAGTDLAVWPPVGAEPIAIEGYYDRLAAQGYGYGPAFHGLRAAWRRGDELFAEVQLPEAVAADAAGFGLHPALLDAALHTLGLGAVPDVGEGRARLPFSWSGVSLHRTGAAGLRVRVTPLDQDAVAVTVADPTGAPVASIESLVTRPVSTESLRAASSPARDAMFAVDWHQLPAAGSAAPVRRWAVLGSGEGADVTDVAAAGQVAGLVSALERSGVTVSCHADLAALAAAQSQSPHDVPDVVVLPCLAGNREGTGLAEASHAALRRVLGVVQAWLDDERFAASRLVVLTRGAVATTPDETELDLPHAAVWGLLRSAQSEHPDRFLLVDVDTATDTATDTGVDSGTDTAVETDAVMGSVRVLGAVVACGEPQVAVRGGALWVPRVVRARVPAVGARDGVWGEGAVLVTGASGVLAGVVVRHLVSACGVRRVVLVSRRAAEQLAAEVRELGAEAVVVACDVADRGALAGVFAAHRISAVVHAAGVLDDGVVGSLSPERVAGVLRPKVDGAVVLDELSRGVDLKAFVLFSSAAGTLGGPGQGSYAAANAFLDALAQRRRALGLPATSLGWGFWEERSGLTGHLGRADLNRMSRVGIAPMTSQEGLALFDAACATDEPMLLPMRLETSALRALAASGNVPPLLSALVRTPVRRTAADGGGAANGAESLQERLSKVSAAERAGALEDLVVAQVASVLGHASVAAVEPGRPFKELGFDSLTAVELRNRLKNATGLRLPATLVFDHPTPEAVAAHLGAKLFPEAANTAPGAGAPGDPAPDDGSRAATGGDRDESQDLTDSIDTMDIDHLVSLALDGKDG
ncbi:SDR family NAD(P)-dependent oxidoreductase [Streptomyces lydicus]|uniref:type I polyketide synthase n=1 Tax=Streptomyces lydicus TaxID=47763 RepID=UPI002E2F610F|nr:SDR family NAD(P)-dependent oxidoreductase [Streptomyces lydicus]